MVSIAEFDGRECEATDLQSDGYWSQIVRLCSDPRRRSEPGIPGLYRHGLAMFVLYEDAGLTIPDIADMFRVNKGRVSRLIRQTRESLQGLASDRNDFIGRLRELAATRQDAPFREITDAEWRRLARLLTTDRRRPGQQPVDSRQCLNGILWRLHHGRGWRKMPPQYGRWKTVWRRWSEWCESGVWRRIAELLPTRDLPGAAID